MPSRPMTTNQYLVMVRQMKDSKIYAKKIGKLFRALKKDAPTIKPPQYDDVMDALVFAIVSENMTMAVAKTAMRKITKRFVDFNDLRVSRPEEIAEVLGDLEELKETAQAIPNILNAIFNRYDKVGLDEFEEIGKRQAKKELEGFNGMTSYICNYCFLTALQGHAIPVNKAMIEYLRENELVHPKASAHDICGFLERQISATDGWQFYILLRIESDTASKTRKPVAKKKTTKKKAAAKKVKAAKKKTTSAKAEKKTPVKKTVKKKTAKKKTTKKKAAKA